jgi:oligopeptide/dipeptide ABC transporter ATP-binding protein
VGIPAPERRLDDYPHQLSGGMCQRVMIAMALACNPKLIIADEPTTALDVTIQAQVLELLKKTQRRHKTSILLITHDMGVVAEMADEVVVMYLGKVVEKGPVEEIFNRPKHPYTQRLFASVPRPNLDRAQPLPSIPGSVPDHLHVPEGCPFRGRCHEEMRICTREPRLGEIAPGHHAACWLYEEAE